LKLLDLDDDALIMIIDKLDHKSKLQMMATCKKFERLIGHTHQFYKNFKLDWNEAKIVAKAHHCSNIQRKFGFVKINGSLYNRSSQILEIIKRIGANVIEVELNDLRLTDIVFTDFAFSMLMELLADVRELTISGRGNIFDSRRPPVDFKFKNLNKLELQAPKNVKLLEALAPDSLKILKLSGIIEDNKKPCWDSEIFAKQKQLEELCLEHFEICVFRYHPENCHIKKLEICDLSFLNQFSFKKFSDFMKLQKSVTELKFNIGNEELKDHDYVETLKCLLGLEYLKKLTIDCKLSSDIKTIFSKISVSNPAVDTLTIMNPRSGADLKLFPKFFPIVTHLKITWDNYNNVVDLKSINSMTQIRKLEIDHMSKQILAELQLNQMRELIILKRVRFIPLDNWKSFFTSHCQLETFHMPHCELSIEFLQITLKSLPFLKSLELKVAGKRMVKYFKKFYPNVRIDRQDDVCTLRK
jgi:hypothetical protein